MVRELAHYRFSPWMHKTVEARSPSEQKEYCLCRAVALPVWLWSHWDASRTQWHRRTFTPAQAKIWDTIGCCRPSEYFDGACHELLVAYCRHADAANVIAKQIEQFTESDLEADLSRTAKLFNMAVRESNALDAEREAPTGTAACSAGWRKVAAGRDQAALGRCIVEGHRHHHWPAGVLRELKRLNEAGQGRVARIIDARTWWRAAGMPEIVPVATGALKRSIKPAWEAEVREGCQAIAFANAAARHSHLVEYGTAHMPGALVPESVARYQSTRGPSEDGRDRHDGLQRELRRQAVPRGSWRNLSGHNVGSAGHRCRPCVSASGVASGLRAAERQSVGGDAQFCMVTLLQRNSF